MRVQLVLPDGWWVSGRVVGTVGDGCLPRRTKAVSEPTTPLYWNSKLTTIPYDEEAVPVTRIMLITRDSHLFISTNEAQP